MRLYYKKKLNSSVQKITAGHSENNNKRINILCGRGGGGWSYFNVKADNVLAHARKHTHIY
jgi:hypothetical protein